MRYTLPVEKQEEMRVKDRAYYAKTAEVRRALLKKRYRNNKDKFRKTNRRGVLKRKYNLLFEEYQQMFESQNGLCYICGTAETGRTLSVDHDHKTNKVRKLLCGNCNRALGLLKDNPDLLEKAAVYIRAYGG